MKTVINIRRLAPALTNKKDTYVDLLTGNRIYPSSVPHFELKPSYKLLPKINTDFLLNVKRNYLSQLQNQDISEKLLARISDSDFNQIFHVQIIDNDLEDDWYQFEQNAKNEFLMEWCNKEGIPCSDEPLPKKSVDEIVHEVTQLVDEALNRNN